MGLSLKLPECISRCDFNPCSQADSLVFGCFRQCQQTSHRIGSIRNGELAKRRQGARATPSPRWVSTDAFWPLWHFCLPCLSPAFRREFRAGFGEVQIYDKVSTSNRCDRSEKSQNRQGVRSPSHSFSLPQEVQERARRCFLGAPAAATTRSTRRLEARGRPWEARTVRGRKLAKPPLPRCTWGNPDVIRRPTAPPNREAAQAGLGRLPRTSSPSGLALKRAARSSTHSTSWKTIRLSLMPGMAWMTCSSGSADHWRGGKLGRPVGVSFRRFIADSLVFLLPGEAKKYLHEVASGPLFPSPGGRTLAPDRCPQRRAGRPRAGAVGLRPVPQCHRFHDDGRQVFVETDGLIPR